MSPALKGSLAVATVALLVSSTKVASACVVTPEYAAKVEGDDVIVSNFAVDCTDASRAMLRQNVATGEIVKLPSSCDHHTWVDRCVPAGSYRYGLERPLLVAEPDCVCGPYAYFIEVEVDGPSPRCASNDVPTSSVPWQNERLICKAPPTCGGFVAPGASPTPCAPPDSPGGCSASGEPPKSSAISAVFAVLAGLLRRRKKF